MNDLTDSQILQNLNDCASLSMLLITLFPFANKYSNLSLPCSGTSGYFISTPLFLFVALINKTIHLPPCVLSSKSADTLFIIIIMQTVQTACCNLFIDIFQKCFWVSLSEPHTSEKSLRSTMHDK